MIWAGSCGIKGFLIWGGFCVWEGFCVWAGFCCMEIPVYGRVSVIWEAFCGMGVSAVWGDFYAILEGDKVDARGFTPWV